MLAAGALLGSPALTLAARRTRAVDARLGHLGLQLYTVRNLMDKDVEGTIAAVAAIGYREVELAGLHNKTAKEMREILDRHGLRARSSHSSMQDIRGNWARTLDDAATLGQTYIVNPWIDEPERTVDGYTKAAHEMTAAAEAARAHGIGFAYHNHDFEFAHVGGNTLFDTLLARTDRQLVGIEMDVYWVTKGGADPMWYLRHHAGRFPMLHLKDATAAPERRMVDVGAGTIDFAELLTLARNQAGHAFVEHDDPTDPLASARASYSYLSRLKY